MSSTPSGPSAIAGGPAALPDRVVPTWTDPVAAQASEAVGGPWGRHAVTGRALFWTPLRVCLLFVVLALSLAWVKQAPCADGDWSGSRQYTHFCYSDAVPLFGSYGLDAGRQPYLDATVEYPVLTGGFMALAAATARGYDGLAGAVGFLPDAPPVQSYYVLTCLLLALTALALVGAVHRLAGRRPWDAAMIGLSPLLVVHAFTNWDLLAVALSTAALLAWARSRPGLAGVLLGSGVAAKLYPVLILGALFLLCLRAGRLTEWSRTAGAAILAWTAVNLPVALAAQENWSWFFAFSRERGANPESIWNMLGRLADGDLFDGPLAEGQAPAVLNAVVTGSLVLAGLGVAWLTFAAPLRPRLPQIAFLLVAAFLLLNKVWSPQYSLWLLPLAVLARPRWRSLLLWQATEVLVWVTTMLHYLGTDDNGIEVGWFFLAVGIRDVAVVVLMGLVVRDVLRPDRDVVRTSWPGVDDPAGGPLERADDVVVLGRRSGQDAPQ